MYSIDRKRWNVITAENPVEIRIPDVEQTPIDGNSMTFAKFVPAALRQDPDYIMIGETRDKETTEEVIRAAITGHVVMTTLHTNSAAGAPARLIDMGGQPFLITDALKAVCAQRLIRRICGNCARPTRDLPTPEELENNQINPKWLAGAEYLLEPVGCKLCNNTGYSGRIAIVEGYFTSPEIRRIIIKENADSEKIRREIENQGGKTLYQHAVEHAAKGTTSLVEAMTVKSLDG
jgi:type IV pilus assembly protein PilB